MKILNKKKLLLVDDSEDDYILLKEAIHDSDIEVNLVHCLSGEEALHYLMDQQNKGKAELPNLILLDLKMPTLNGFEILKRLKHDPILQQIPIVVLSSSDLTGDIRKSYELLANSYIVKPFDYDELILTVKSLTNYWFKISRLPYD
ncbi:MAG: response regulator [Candidatus Heimdallarchaeota archaeon]|nr:response regulator [Candidatus Heimdallarchaeota archaeon]MDH5645813.1 response regulator [Candidatus Heimdallarchaeota archaeon]